MAKRPRVVTSSWVSVAAATLLCGVLDQNPHLKRAVVVVMVMGGLDDLISAVDYSRGPGRRIVRLLYRLEDIEAEWRADELLSDALERLAAPGHVFRAMVRYARSKPPTHAPAVVVRKRRVGVDFHPEY